ncbi:MAG: trigger factor [Acetobacteraceae bacterium]|nr:trigger factor [Acetobacteraceae bacterium]
MQVTETLSDGLKRAFSVVVPAADLESRRLARLTDLGKTLRLPGFRPGRVPLPIVKQRYGSAVGAEVLEESVSQAMQQVITDRGLRPAMQPRVNITSTDLTGAEAKDLEFNVELEVLPEIAMPDFSSITLTRFKAEVADAEVEKQIAEIASRNRDLVDVEEDRGAETGEVLTIDYAGTVDGAAFPGGTGTDLNVAVGGTGFVPGFSDQLAGMRPGETRTVAVTFPAEYGVKELAGKAASFEVTAKTLRRPVDAAIDDAFAEKIGFENLAELRTAISGRMRREYDQLSRMRLKRQLLDALAERATFEPPQGMVDAEFDQIWARLDEDRKEGRLDEEDKGKDEETLKAEYRAIADRRVRLGLLLAEIGRSNAITVTDDEMSRAIRAEAMRYPGQEAQVLDMFRKNPAIADNLRGPIFEEKVVDYVVELAAVTEESVTPEELAREPDAPAPPAEPAPVA